MAKPPSLIGGTNLQMNREPRCKICTSPLVRDRVDRLAAAGFGGSAIADEIMGLDPKLPKKRDSLRKSIERHVSKHLKIKDAAVRRILERRAEEQGILIDQVEGQMVSGKAFLDMMIGRGQEQLSDPNSRVYNKDVLEAIRLQEDFERESFALQLEVIERQVRCISQALKEIVSERMGQIIDEYMFEQVAERARYLFGAEAKEQLAIEEGQVVDG